MIVLIDNYDSFTFNLYSYLGFFEQIRVLKNTESLSLLKNISDLKAIVISPGPSHPKNAMLSVDAVEFFGGRLPIFGVCLGMQVIGFVYGFSIRRAKTVMHGRVDKIQIIENSVIFEGINETFDATRYHSFVVDGSGDGFSKTAISLSDNETMAIENSNLKIYGVQFHPESYTTQFGLQIVKNFIKGVCHVD
ncbi:anthranilate synthase component II [Hippea jasoniae]|uniref:anthranilate synthase component II n=1 Tax=Hippea jasoniae TaxID=944479 RepID=UPI0005536AA3|nr:aminodeoxychorismate/anthranilate synthase component II [Hippea jasoniae]